MSGDPTQSGGAGSEVQEPSGQVPAGGVPATEGAVPPPEAGGEATADHAGASESQAVSAEPVARFGLHCNKSLGLYNIAGKT
mgnify:CR=1 FL=1